MSMSGMQQAAWQSANTGSSAFTAASLGTLIVGIIGVVMVLWFCWVAIGAFRAAGKPGGNWGELPNHIGRALFMMIVILAVITFS